VKRRRPAWPAALALLAVPACAHAHLASTGLGPLYDGIAHLFVSFEDLLPVIALAMLAGPDGAIAVRRILFTLPLAWLVGGVAGALAAAPPLPAGLPAVSMLLLGGLVAADRALAPAVVTALAVALGLVHGWQNGAAIAVASLQATALAGTAAAVFVTTALVGAFVVALRRPWTRIAVRVAGSWIAASGLLLLGWSLSGRG
jgi:urease accessory protein